MKLRTRLHQWWMWRAEDSPVWGHKIICALLGHEPGADCALPQHDFCLWCMKSMPGKAPRR